MGREELFLAEHTPSHHKQQGWGSGGGSHESEEKRRGRGRLLMPGSAKDGSTHFSICKCDLFLAPKRNANQTWRVEGGKGRPSSLATLCAAVGKKPACAGAAEGAFTSVCCTHPSLTVPGFLKGMKG